MYFSATEVEVHTSPCEQPTDFIQLHFNYNHDLYQHSIIHNSIIVFVIIAHTKTKFSIREWKIVGSNTEHVCEKSMNLEYSAIFYGISKCVLRSLVKVIPATDGILM